MLLGFFPVCEPPRGQFGTGCYSPVTNEDPMHAWAAQKFPSTWLLRISSLHFSFQGFPFLILCPQSWDFTYPALLHPSVTVCIWAKWQEDREVPPHPPGFATHLIRKEGSSAKFWLLRFLLVCSLCRHCCCQQLPKVWEVWNQKEETQVQMLLSFPPSKPELKCLFWSSLHLCLLWGFRPLHWTWEILGSKKMVNSLLL